MLHICLCKHSVLLKWLQCCVLYDLILFCVNIYWLIFLATSRSSRYCSYSCKVKVMWWSAWFFFRGTPERLTESQPALKRADSGGFTPTEVGGEETRAFTLQNRRKTESKCEKRSSGSAVCRLQCGIVIGVDKPAPLQYLPPSSSPAAHNQEIVEVCFFIPLVATPSAGVDAPFSDDFLASKFA